jgi:hypothetical protein
MLASPAGGGLTPASGSQTHVVSPAGQLQTGGGEPTPVPEPVQEQLGSFSGQLQTVPPPPLEPDPEPVHEHASPAPPCSSGHSQTVVPPLLEPEAEPLPEVPPPELPPGTGTMPPQAATAKMLGSPTRPTSPTKRS